MKLLKRERFCKEQIRCSYQDKKINESYDLTSFLISDGEASYKIQ